MEAMSIQNGVEPKLVDMRSDTITKPPAGMRKAMAEAEVGDDVYGEDPTVNELQRRCADLFGMEAALFVPTGTMANLIAKLQRRCADLFGMETALFVPTGTISNLIAILVHCKERGQEAIVGHKSHILLNEQAGISQFAGVLARTIDNKPDGTFDIAQLRKLIRPTDDVHQPYTRLICLENSHNYCGGKALPLSFVKQIWDIAQENNIKVHTDGARILNSAVALGVPVSEIVKYSHSVYMCFSKGLAAPVGSILDGNKDFIYMARRMRKALGGGMRQAGVLAAAALYSLDHVVPRLHEDHGRILTITKAVKALNSSIVEVEEEGILTNIAMFEMKKPGLGAEEFCQRLLKTEEERESLQDSIVVKAVAVYPHIVRIVTHNDLTDDHIHLAIKKLVYVIKEYEQ